MRKFRQLEKWTALFCAGLMAAVSLTGCGADGGADGTENKRGSTDTDAAEAERSMGRYMEEDLALPEMEGMQGYTPNYRLWSWESGELVLAEEFMGKYFSADNGESWEEAGCPWSDLLGGYYISGFAFSPDGGTALVCSTYEGEESAEEAGEESGENPEEEPAEETEEERSSEEENEIPESLNLEWQYFYIAPEGDISEIPFPGDRNMFIRWFEFDRQGRLYGYATDNRVYRFDLDAGTQKELFEVEKSIDYICFTERYMVGFTTGGEAVIYDLETEMLAEEDEVLQEFMKENVGQLTGDYDGGHSVIAAQGEQEDIIYLAFQGGLYRHVIGGTVMEQVIDGAMSAFGDPSAILIDMAMLPDNEFIVLYSGEKLCKYTYDPNVPTVPERELSVYSLVENYSVRQAVSLFQKAHQDVYVRYEIGMSGGDGVTREDAVRNLNTKIMAGEGPDVLLLDGLPQASYEEKGVLADVSEVVDGMDKDSALFPNIVDACRKDGKIYALPIRIQIPMVVGKKEYVQKIKDLDSLADAVEEMRDSYPEGALLGLESTEELLYVLTLTSSAAWTDEKGNINEEALEEFLTDAARIWQAESSGIDAETPKEETNYSSKFSGGGMDYATASTCALNIAVKRQQIGVGKLYKVDFDYDTITSIAGLEDDFAYGFWNGQVENGFIPDGMAGILAGAAEDELALEFYRFLFGRELQDMDLTGGFPVNMASFDTFMENPAGDQLGFDENFAGGIFLGSDTGIDYTLDLLWPSEEELRNLKEMADGVSVVSVGDAAIEEAVYDVGKEMLDGDMTPKEAVQEIVKRAAIYLAE